MNRLRQCAMVLIIVGGTGVSLAQSSAAPPAAAGYSAAALYNLANSYARGGKPGLAVLNYERARLLAPNDADIEANLSFVRRSSGIPAEPSSWLDRAGRVASPTALAWAGVLGLLIAGGNALLGRIGARFRTVRARLARGIAMMIGMAMLGLTLVNALRTWPTVHSGVVLTAAAPVRVSPVPMGDPLFLLPEAATVLITAEHESFMLIEAQGKSGWVSQANIARIVPLK